jgi:hypothetical protein
MKKKGGRDQRQHQASSREAISDAPAADDLPGGFRSVYPGISLGARVAVVFPGAAVTAVLPEAAGQFFPAAVPVGKTLFGQGIRPV